MFQSYRGDLVVAFVLYPNFGLEAFRNLGNISYSVNAASTTISKNGALATISSIAVGDYIVVQGTVNGSSVTASSIIDQVNTTPSSNGNGNNGNGKAIGHMNFFGSIGNFFKNLFGF